jgi:hypothetical protein
MKRGQSTANRSWLCLCRSSRYQRNERKTNKRWPPIGESSLLDNWNCKRHCIFFSSSSFYLVLTDSIGSPNTTILFCHRFETRNEWMNEKRKEKKNPKRICQQTRRAIVSAATYTSLSVGANKYVNKLFFCLCMPTFTIHIDPCTRWTRSQVTAHIRCLDSTLLLSNSAGIAMWMQAPMVHWCFDDNTHLMCT